MNMVLLFRIALFCVGVGGTLWGLVWLNRRLRGYQWTRGGDKRLQVLEATALDDKNRLILVRVDQQEYVVVVGPQGGNLQPLIRSEESQLQGRTPVFLREVARD